jgi:excisionase family DNA binding protein
MADKKDFFLSTADAARRLGLTPIRVRQMANQGKLPVIRTSSGVRLFRAEDIEEERRRRQEQKAAKKLAAKGSRTAPKASSIREAS